MTAQKRRTGTGVEYITAPPQPHVHPLSDIGLTALPPRGMRRAQSALRSDPMLLRSEWPGDGGLSNGTDTYGNYESAHPVVGGATITRVELIYVNAYLHEDVVPNNSQITVRASVRGQSGAAYPAFCGSSRTAVIEPGGMARFLATVRDNVGVFVRSNVDVASGDKWPLSGPGSGGTSLWVAERYETGTGGNVDKTTSGAAIAGVGGYMFRPFVVLGTADTIPDHPGVTAGDSIAYGIGDLTGPFPDAGKGFMNRALGTALPRVSIAIGGEQAQWMASDTYRQLRGVMIDGAAWVLCNLARNDFAASRTSAQVAADLLAFATYCQNKGAKFYQTTITPDTDTTDSYATASGQTPRAWTAARQDLNGWLRALAPIDPASKARVAIGTGGALLTGQAGHPFTGIFDVAARVECDNTGALALNGGRWRTDLGLPTTDGVHPQTVLHVAMAAAIDVPTLKAA